MRCEDVSGSLERYVAAWKSGERGEIEALFGKDARYRYHSYDEPLVGRAAIADSWLDDPDEPGSFDASYECFAADGDAAVAIGTSTTSMQTGKSTRVRQRLCASLRRRGPLLRLHGVVREASVNRSAAAGGRLVLYPTRPEDPVMAGMLYDDKAAAQLEQAYATTDMIVQRKELDNHFEHQPAKRSSNWFRPRVPRL